MITSSWQNVASLSTHGSWDVDGDGGGIGFGGGKGGGRKSFGLMRGGGGGGIGGGIGNGEPGGGGGVGEKRQNPQLRRQALMYWSVLHLSILSKVVPSSRSQSPVFSSSHGSEDSDGDGGGEPDGSGGDGGGVGQYPQLRGQALMYWPVLHLLILSMGETSSRSQSPVFSSTHGSGGVDGDGGGGEPDGSGDGGGERQYPQLRGQALMYWSVLHLRILSRVVPTSRSQNPASSSTHSSGGVDGDGGGGEPNGSGGDGGGVGQYPQLRGQALMYWR